MPDLTELATQLILYIQRHDGDNTEILEIEAILLYINKLHSKTLKQQQTQQAIDNLL